MIKKSDYMISRRGFVGGVIGIVGAIITAVIGIPAIAYIIAPALAKAGGLKWITLGPASNIKPGVPTMFSYLQMTGVGWQRINVSNTVYAVTGANCGDLIVLSNVCTHLGCHVHWDDQQAKFLCPCHGGEYNTCGDVVAGPPPRPLPRYQAKIENGQLMIYAEV